VTQIPKRLRYEVLRRDNFTCRYCGASAPEAKLTVDAVTPEVLGGSHRDPANLVTACDPCNSGKTSSTPDAPLVADVQQDALRWAQAREIATQGMVTEFWIRQEYVSEFDQAWRSWHAVAGGEEIPRDADWEASVAHWYAIGVPAEMLETAIRAAMNNPKVIHENRWRYFCGIVWNIARELDSTTEAVARVRAAREEGVTGA
jgi:HNH endonuclease